jgi:hypothetical protein
MTAATLDIPADWESADQAPEFESPLTPPPMMTAPAAGNADPDAPYGRRADGTPKAKPGRKGSGAAPAAPRAVSAPRPRTTAATGRPAARKSPTGAVDYRPGLNGWLQILSLPLALAGRVRPVLALDAAAVSIHGPGVTDALNTVAQDQPEVAAVLDKIMAVGPYGVLIGAIIPLVAQIGANHGKIPSSVATGMGAIDPATLKDQLDAHSRAMTDQATHATNPAAAPVG